MSSIGRGGVGGAAERGHGGMIAAVVVLGAAACDGSGGGMSTIGRVGGGEAVG
jgi:hypothetical protein